MKDALFSRIVSYEMLVAGFQRAARKCRRSIDRAEFVLDLPREIAAIRVALLEDRYSWGPYVSKIVEDPKRREIWRAPFRDRVVHQAIFAVIEPLVEKRMIHQSYACRVGRGTRLALRDSQRAARNCSFALKLDVSKFFASIDHAALKRKVFRVVTEPRTQRLLGSLIDSFGPGIPIGNLTSQLFANWYLNDLDHFVKRELHVPQYFRYMDDILLFGDDKDVLWKACEAVVQRVAEDRLLIPPRKISLFATTAGVPFLGYRLFNVGRPRVMQRSLRRFKEQLRLLRCGKIGQPAMRATVTGWYGHARYGVPPKLTRDLGVDGIVLDLAKGDARF